MSEILDEGASIATCRYLGKMHVASGACAQFGNCLIAFVSKYNHSISQLTNISQIELRLKMKVKTMIALLCIASVTIVILSESGVLEQSKPAEGM